MSRHKSEDGRQTGSLNGEEVDIIIARTISMQSVVEEKQRRAPNGNARRNQPHDSHWISKRDSKILHEDTMKLIAPSRSNLIENPGDP